MINTNFSYNVSNNIAVVVWDNQNKHTQLLVANVIANVKRKLSLSVYWSIYVCDLTSGHRLRVLTERTRQTAEMSLCHMVAGLS